MKLIGKPSSPGKAGGRIRIITGTPRSAAGPSSIAAVGWDEAVAKVKAQLDEARIAALKRVGEEAASIFEAQMALADDPFLKEKAFELSPEGPNSDAAVQASEAIARMFDEMEDEYIRGRAADIRQVGSMIADALGGGLLKEDDQSAEAVSDPSIIAAEDLSPLQAVNVDDDVVGIVLEGGTVNSHASILSRSMGIPCIVGVAGLMDAAKDGIWCEIDADDGEIYLHEGKSAWAQSGRRDSARSGLYARRLATKDGHEVSLALNVGNPAELDKAAEGGLSGIDVGLMRTEFLYMGSSSLPGVMDQKEAYLRIASKAHPGLVRFRTLDIGGDKKPAFIDIPKEDNPYLGLRSIRHSLKNAGIFKDQLRALLLTSVEQPLEIMFPMVTVIEELIEARRLLSETLESISGVFEAGRGFKVGIMLETPAACLMADALAEHCDFMSIGTNDLVQYTMAADRGNPSVSQLYQQMSPALLRLVKICVDACKGARRELSVCGELAGSPEGAVLLAGHGVDKLSMTPSSTGRVAMAISRLSMSEMKDLAQEAITMDTQDEVMDLVRSRLR